MQGIVFPVKSLAFKGLSGTSSKFCHTAYLAPFGVTSCFLLKCKKFKFQLKWFGVAIFMRLNGGIFVWSLFVTGNTPSWISIVCMRSFVVAATTMEIQKLYIRTRSLKKLVIGDYFTTNKSDDVESPEYWQAIKN